MSEARELAEFAHKHLCRENHTDRCGWMYEVNYDTITTPNWSGWTRKRWLVAAQELLSNKVSLEAAKETILAFERC